MQSDSQRDASIGWASVQGCARRGSLLLCMGSDTRRLRRYVWAGTPLALEASIDADVRVRVRWLERESAAVGGREPDTRVLSRDDEQPTLCLLLRSRASLSRG